MEKRNVLNSPRLSELKRRRHRAILNKFLFSFFGLLAIFILSAYLSHLNSLNISEIEISGNKTIDTEAVKETVQEQISGKYLWLFPKTNILYYSKSNIKNKLLDEFKRIKSVDLSILPTQAGKNNILQIFLTERTAAYIWCGETPVSGVGGAATRPPNVRNLLFYGRGRLCF